MDLLPGFGFTGFRSIRGPLQLVGPLSKVNLVAGQNNAGKSNVLRVAQRYIDHPAPAPTGLDTPRQSDSAHFTFAVARRLDRADLRAAFDARDWNADGWVAQLVRIFDEEEFRLTGDDLVWFQYKVEGGASQSQVAQYRLNAQPLTAIIERDRRWASTFTDLSRQIAGQSGGGELSDLARIVHRFSTVDDLPPVRSLEAFRQITAASEDVTDDFYTGRGLIRGLQRLQSPRIDRQDDKDKFETINSFIQTILEDSSARLDVPHDAASIHVLRGDLVLPLENLGTGVHQVVILAVAATLLENTLICVEEPEVHLHPLLQRKLVRYLNDRTNNQYLIATHSAHMLDHERASVFHVQQTSSGTEVQRAGTPAEVAALCADLGYRPSDLLQANAIIWVEGPSDRIYLRRWISLIDDALAEGVHYSIMFYGGRLLNHLTAKDPLIDEFISLRALNRHIAILIDSDKNSPQAQISATKKRVRDELNDSKYPGFAWITDCRTIENYVPLGLLRESIDEVHPDVTLTYGGAKWDNPLSVTSNRRGKAEPRVDKIRLAHVASRDWTVDHLDHQDLSKQLRRVVEFIRAANGSPTA